MNDRRIRHITSLLLIAAFATALLLCVSCSQKKKKRRKARAATTESTAVVAANEESPDKPKARPESPTPTPETAVEAAEPAPDEKPPEAQEPQDENTAAVEVEAESPAEALPEKPAPKTKEHRINPEDVPVDAPNPEEEVNNSNDGNDSDAPPLEVDEPNENDLDSELVPDEAPPPVVAEGSHEVVGTSGDIKAPWLALKAGPAPGSKYNIVAEMPDGTQLNVVEMGFGKRGQWWYVRVMSGPHKGTQGYAHSKWIRER